MPDLSPTAVALLVVAAVLVLVTCVVAVVLVVRLVKKYKVVHQPGMPVSAKVAFYGSLVYTVFPVDLLPDPVLLDDIGVLAGALVYIGRTAQKLRATATGAAPSSDAAVRRDNLRD